MATTSLYTKFPKALANAEINWIADTIKVALVTSAYSPNQDVHGYFSDIVNEATGTGYTAGGATLVSKTVTQADASNKQTFDAADVAWPGSTITARYAVIYKSTGSGNSSPLIGYVDFGVDQASTSGTFQIQWNAAGIFTTSVA